MGNCDFRTIPIYVLFVHCVEALHCTKGHLALSRLPGGSKDGCLHERESGLRRNEEVVYRDMHEKNAGGFGQMEEANGCPIHAGDMHNLA